MNKAIIALMVLGLALVLIFGCTQTGPGLDNNIKVNSDLEASKTIDDVGSDISGINDSLSEIDLVLTDTNA